MNVLNAIQKSFRATDAVKISGGPLSMAEIVAYAMVYPTVEFRFSKRHEDHIREGHEAVMNFAKNGDPIYGISASYGKQAHRVLDSQESSGQLRMAESLSKAILHVDVSVGTPLPREIVRPAMLIRLNSLAQGLSGVSMEELECFRLFLNTSLTPLIGQYGSLGASGDLAQNGRVLSALLHLDHVHLLNPDGKRIVMSQALKTKKYPMLTLKPKTGLAFVNGDNFSVAAASLFTLKVSVLMYVNTILSAGILQVLKGTNRSFHPLLEKVRSHPGQQFSASLYRKFLAGSKLSYDEMRVVQPRVKGYSVQDRYSLRCLSQFTGPDWEKIERAWQVMDISINSVSDNPLFASPKYKNPQEPAWSWIAGGNFLGMYAADILDDLRKILTRIVKLNDRHLALLVNEKENNGLSANLSDKESISQCAMKGLQNQMGMMEVYASVLSVPVTTFFGVHEEGNQDITAHGLTSWIMGNTLLELATYALATNIIAFAQAVDLRGGKALLSPLTQPLYDLAREEIPYIRREQPLGHYVENVQQRISSLDAMKELVTKRLRI